MMGRLKSVFGVALMLGAAGVLALTARNMLLAYRYGHQAGGTPHDGLVAAYYAPGVIMNGVIAVVLFVLGVGLLRSVQQRRVSRLVIGALGLVAVLLLGVRAGYIVL